MFRVEINSFQLSSSRSSLTALTDLFIGIKLGAAVSIASSSARCQEMPTTVWTLSELRKSNSGNCDWSTISHSSKRCWMNYRFLLEDFNPSKLIVFAIYLDSSSSLSTLTFDATPICVWHLLIESNQVKFVTVIQQGIDRPLTTFAKS